MISTKKYPKSGYEKDPEYLHHYIKGIRILSVGEWEKIYNVIPTNREKTIFELLTITGMRYIEMLRLYENPSWFIQSANIIHLPEEGQRKKRRTQQERNITPLMAGMKYLLNEFHTNKKPPHADTWNKHLQAWGLKAGISPFGLSAKTTRKTIESWLFVSGFRESEVCLRQGHNTIVSMRHYQGLSFTDAEKTEIRSKLKSWGLL